MFIITGNRIFTTLLFCSSTPDSTKSLACVAGGFVRAGVKSLGGEAARGMGRKRLKNLKL